MNIYEVQNILKQRPPFQMIERVTELEPGVRATGSKTVSVNEPWFAGHFPGTPLMPGVLIVESCAQLCSLVAQTAAQDGDDRLYVLLKLDNFKFLRPVLPGEVMTVSVVRRNGAGPLVTFDAVVKVDEDVRAKGAISFTAVPRDTVGAGN